MSWISSYIPSPASFAPPPPAPAAQAPQGHPLMTGLWNAPPSGPQGHPLTQYQPPPQALPGLAGFISDAQSGAASSMIHPSVGMYQQQHPAQGSQFIDTASPAASPGPPPAPTTWAPQMQDPQQRPAEYGMNTGGWGFDGSQAGSQFQTSTNGGQSWTQSGPGQDTATANPNRWNQADNGVAPGTWTRK